MKSIRIRFLAALLLTLFTQLLAPLRADSSDALQPATLSLNTQSGDSTLSFDTAPAASPFAQDAAFGVKTGAVYGSSPLVPHALSLHFSFSRLVDELETGFMNSLPLLALVLLCVGLRQSFFERRPTSAPVEEVELPVVIPPRRTPTYY